MSFTTDDTLQIGGLYFKGGEGDEGFFIDSDGFEGWEDLPDVRFENLDRANAHGAYESDTFYEARLLNVSGMCHASSAADLGAYGQHLRTALHGKRRAVVNYQGVTSYAEGRLSSGVAFRTLVPGRIATYDFTYRFANPRKYGDERGFDSGPNGLQYVYHYGNFDASPRIVVTGSGPSYVINGPDNARYEVNRPVVAGSPHSIDMATGQITIDGSVAYGVTGRADTWVVRSGVQEATRLVTSSGALSMTTYVRDTYI